ncbi:MAG: apolipoprotein N-acyltransferase [Pontibacterium sp.]
MIIRLLLSLLAGATVTAALAPFNQVWLVGLPPLLLFLLLDKAPLKQAPLLGWFFGLGFFGAGVSWVFVSIYEHSATPLVLAVLLTALFVMALALLFMVQAWCWKRWLQGPLATFSFVAIWVLGEWLRSWLLTGFPWLYLGYAATETPLSAWAPVGGVWLNSLIFVASGLLLFYCFKATTMPRRLISLLLLILPWALLPLVSQPWTKVSGEAFTVTLIQADINQEKKWDPNSLEETLSTYEQLTLPHQGDALIIWPETAISAFFRQASPLIQPLLNQLDDSGSTFISGLPTTSFGADGQRRYHNSLAVLTGGSGVYHKQRLVPFGEYIPLENYLRDTLAFFNLPMSGFSLPSEEQALLSVNGYALASAICYEIAYPELVRLSSRKADFILTVSNDTWFGHSIAPDQHMQIARMRALETGRWVIRATNNGISGLINPDGEIVKQAPRFTQASLSGTLEPRNGQTPFQHLGSWPVLIFSLLLCLFSACQTGRQRRLNQQPDL